MKSYTVVHQKKTVYGWLYKVFADDDSGAQDFINETDEVKVEPGSRIFIADGNRVLKLLNSGVWSGDHEDTRRSSEADEGFADYMIAD